MGHVEEVGSNAHVACVYGGFSRDVMKAVVDLTERPDNLFIMADHNNIIDKQNKFKNEVEFGFSVDSG